MKIDCRCGARISDATDCLPHKAHFVSDQDWNAMWDAIDEALENSGPGDKEAVLMTTRRRIGSLFRLAWQCRACGRVYMDDQSGELREFLPASTAAPREAFRARPSPDQPTERHG
jgi:hypothetical protein